MKRFWPLLLLVIPYQSIHAQKVQHAPTVEQGRADQKLWLSELEELNHAGTVNVSFVELQGRISETMDCWHIDQKFWDQYAYTNGETYAEQLVRLMHFLDRHHLFTQFLAEDAQGQR